MAHDLETPLLSKSNPSKHNRLSCFECLTLVGNHLMQWMLLLLFCSIVALIFVTIGILFNKSGFTTTPEGVSATPELVSASVSSFLMSAPRNLIWDVTFSLNKNVANFSYDSKTWVYKDDAIISVQRINLDSFNINGPGRLLSVGFEKTIRIYTPVYDQESVLDIFVEANVTYNYRSSLKRPKSEFVTIDCNDLRMISNEMMNRRMFDVKGCKLSRFATKLDAMSGNNDTIDREKS